MRILTAYVLQSYMRLFLLSLGGLTSFLLVVGIATESIREGLRLSLVLQIIPFLVPDSMRLSIPAAALMAACGTFGRMAGENEILAIKAAGASPWQVLKPALAAAFLVSLSALWIGDLALRWGRPGIDHLIISSLEQIAYAVLTTQKTFARDEYSITVQRVVDRTLVAPVITFHKGGPTGAGYTVTARQAELRSDPTDSSLHIAMVDAAIEGSDGMEGAMSGAMEFAVPLRRSALSTSPLYLPFRELGPETIRERERIVNLRSELAAEATFQLLTGDFDQLASRTWRDREKALSESEYRLARLQTEPYKRWALGFSCFFFTLIGGALAIRLGHADVVTIFFLVFLPIVVVYYPMLALGADQAKSGSLPPYAVWLGNGILLLGGIWQVRKVIRH